MYITVQRDGCPMRGDGPNTWMQSEKRTSGIGHCQAVTRMRIKRAVGSVKMEVENMGEKTYTFTEAQLKELTANAYKEGLAKAIPPVDPNAGTIEEAKEIQRKTLGELLGLTDPSKTE